VITLKEAKIFCRIDNDEEDALIESLIKTADEYIESACGTDYEKNSEKAKLCQALLVNHWYENRSLIGNKKALPYSIENLLLQLRYGIKGSDENDKN